MKFLAFLFLALAGTFILTLSQTGFFNVNPWLVFKQTRNILSKEEPIGINIPSLRTKTAIERVGIDELGKMDAPSNASIVSWYQFSAIPGEKGNLVLSGHKDSSIGPGVFFTLWQIENNAEIILTKANNENVTYKVTNVRQYKREELPTKEIFANQSKDKTLYIITCDGNFDIFKKIYDKRIVVTAKTT